MQGVCYDTFQHTCFCLLQTHFTALKWAHSDVPVVSIQCVSLQHLQDMTGSGAVHVQAQQASGSPM